MPAVNKVRPAGSSSMHSAARSSLSSSPSSIPQVLQWRAMDYSLDMDVDFYLDEVCWSVIFCPFLLPCLSRMKENSRQVVLSQKISISSTHLEFQCQGKAMWFLTSPTISTHKMKLEDIWWIQIGKTSMLIKALPLVKKHDVSLFGFREEIQRDNTLKDVFQYITKYRPSKHRAASTIIPSMTSIFQDTTFHIHPDTLSIEFVDDKSSTSTTLFIDSLGNVEVVDDSMNGVSRLEFWSPPVDRPHADSGDYPALTVNFPSAEASSQFRKTIERLRDSFL